MEAKGQGIQPDKRGVGRTGLGGGEPAFHGYSTVRQVPQGSAIKCPKSWRSGVGGWRCNFMTGLLEAPSMRVTTKSTRKMRDKTSRQQARTKCSFLQAEKKSCHQPSLGLSHQPNNGHGCIRPGNTQNLPEYKRRAWLQLPKILAVTWGIFRLNLQRLKCGFCLWRGKHSICFPTLGKLEI